MFRTMALGLIFSRAAPTYYSKKIKRMEEKHKKNDRCLQRFIEVSNYLMGPAISTSLEYSRIPKLI